MAHIEKYFYYQDEMHATVLEINYDVRRATQILDVNPYECMNDDSFKYISLQTKEVLLTGLHKSFFFLEVISASMREPTEKENRRMLFWDIINKRVSNPDYVKYIQKENELFNKSNEMVMKYFDLNNEWMESITKIDKEPLHQLQAFNKLDEELPIAERQDILIESMINSEKSGYKEFREAVKNDPNYIASNELQKKVTEVFFEYTKSFIELENFMNEEYNALYSDAYKKRQDEFADKGLFLYCLNTPDLPLDSDDVSIDDFYDYFLLDNGLYLKDIIHPFVDYPDVGEIYCKEADDLKASFDLMIENKCWAALRNLYSLIEHHHKLCASAFNGFYELKHEFKNGKERSNYISSIFDGFQMTNYEKAWNKINIAIEDMNKGKSTIFPNRNAIIHGDYDNKEINPTQKDVVNLILIYCSLRKMADHIKNVEEIATTMRVYLLGNIYMDEIAKNK